MKKYNIIVLIVIILSLSIFSGCSKRGDKQIISIAIKENSFKATYAIDEMLNYDNIFILVTYENGDNEYIKCVDGMVIGFDSSTTASKRSLYVEFKGNVSKEISYEVVYPDDNTKQISTKARLFMVKSVKNNLLNLQISMFNKELVNIQTIMFTLSSTEMLNLSENGDNISTVKPNGWAISYHIISLYSVRFVFYNHDNLSGLSDNTEFAISINNGNATAKLALKDIEIATGGDDVKTFYLPNAKEN